ncbi:MAG: EamA family transporter RarD, partial [Chloroflexales bacterium]|nr:EamA family transporter RarD [Chloroflexales bacterium]
MSKGIVYAAGAYVAWGLLPIFWKALHGVPAFEILAHRIVWALLVGAALIGLRGRWGALGAALRNRRTLLTFVASSLLLAFNWLIYIWAVNDG